MSFRVTYPVGSTFTAPNPVPDVPPLEDFTDEDAFAFLPGGVLGIWDERQQRSYFLAAGQWETVSASGGHRPGVRRSIMDWEPVPALYGTPGA